MKNLSHLFIVVMFLTACQTKESEKTNAIKTDTTTYPYVIKKVQNWEMNPDAKNAVVAMNMVKAFERLDAVGMGNFLEDSVFFDFDGYKFKGTKPEFIKEIQSEFAKMSSFKIEMQDVESVINKDKSEEWVSLWYSQISTTKEGKSDTINLYNDIKLKNGKIVRLSEYAQHPMKK